MSSRPPGNPAKPPTSEAALPKDSEALWIGAARAGDREAFGRLVRLHGDAVHNAARHLAGNAEDADDLTQEVFLRAWRSLGSFREAASLRTWLLAIAANAARSLRQLRGAQKRSARVISLSATRVEGDLDPPEPDGRGSPEARAMRVELKESLEGAIALLDDEARAALVLRDLEGQSYESIAGALGLPLGTVKSRIHRARLELRERLGGIL